MFELCLLVGLLVVLLLGCLGAAAPGCRGAGPGVVPAGWVFVDQAKLVALHRYANAWLQRRLGLGLVPVCRVWFDDLGESYGRCNGRRFTIRVSRRFEGWVSPERWDELVEVMVHETAHAIDGWFNPGDLGHLRREFVAVYAQLLWSLETTGCRSVCFLSEDCGERYYRPARSFHDVGPERAEEYLRQTLKAVR